MRDYVDIGEVPCNENCAMVGQPWYDKVAKIEMAVFREQIREQIPEAKDLSIAVKKNRHDFGIYYSMEISFDDEDEELVELVFEVESKIPDDWSTKSKARLNELLPLDYKQFMKQNGTKWIKL